jgi:2'-5' RNA ligase
VGCEALPVLELLQDSVEREMSALGFAIEGRPFRPHVTIGRVTRGARNSDFKGLKKDLAKIDYVAEPLVAGVDVMQSILSQGGPRYVQLVRVELTS